ncbi:MAG TPA: porin [Planctomycetota bacterium]
MLALCVMLTTQDPPKPDETPVEVYLKDGLRFRTKDGMFEARIGGRFLGHVRTIFDRPDDDTDPRRTVPNTAFVRQARLEMEGTFYKEWGFKVQTDFGSGTINQSAFGTGPSNVSGTLRDAFVEWKKYKEFQLRFGQFFEPVSQEDMTSTRFIDFVERSPINRLMPGREIGLQAAGTLFDDVLSYAVMALNGGALINDQGRAVVDREDEKELAVQLRLKPFVNSGNDILKGLRVGVGASVGTVDSIAATGFDLVTTELSVLYLDSTVNTFPFDGQRTRIVPQLSWPIGPFCLSAEYVMREDELADGAPESEVESTGWYVAATYILTGEEKKPETRIVPKSDWGAVELAVRFANVTVDNAVDAGIAAAGPGNSEEVSTITFGVNWWITRYVRVSVNGIIENYDEELQFETRLEDSLFGLLFRGQIDF